MYIDLSLPIIVDTSETQVNAREEALMRVGHLGTHLDHLLKSTIPLEYVKSRAVKFDVTLFSQKRAVEPGDFPLESVQAGDFVIFQSGAIQRHGYGSREYLDEYFELSWESIDRLIERKIRFIGIDARGVRRNQEHRKADMRCEQAGVFIIENMNNTEQLPTEQSFVIYTQCFDLGGTGLPCRMTAEVNVPV
jgi:kynurenine formamidase